MTVQYSPTRRFINTLRSFKSRKHSPWFLCVSMGIAAAGWILFLVFFARVDPIIASTTKDNTQLYRHKLITLPFWFYTFGAVMIYPLLAVYIASGNDKLAFFAQIGGTVLGILIGSVLNISAAVVHVIRNLDSNSVTTNICIAGLVGIVASLLNLIVIMASFPVFDRLSATKHAYHGLSTEEPVGEPEEYQQEYQQEYQPEEEYQQESYESDPVYQNTNDAINEPVYQNTMEQEPIYEDMKSPPPPRPPPPIHKKSKSTKGRFFRT